MIGGINTLSGITLASIYSLFLQTNIAFVLGYITALIAAFFLNSYFVFHNKPGFTKLIRFIISYIPNFAIQNVLVLILYNGFGWHRLLVFVLAAIIGIPITFLILKFFAFNKEGSGTMRK